MSLSSTKQAKHVYLPPPVQSLIEFPFTNAMDFSTTQNVSMESRDRGDALNILEVTSRKYLLTHDLYVILFDGLVWSEDPKVSAKIYEILSYLKQVHNGCCADRIWRGLTISDPTAEPTKTTIVSDLKRITDLIDRLADEEATPTGSLYFLNAQLALSYLLSTWKENTSSSSNSTRNSNLNSKSKSSSEAESEKSSTHKKRRKVEEFASQKSAPALPKPLAVLLNSTRGSHLNTIFEAAVKLAFRNNEEAALLGTRIMHILLNVRSSEHQQLILKHYARADFPSRYAFLQNIKLNEIKLFLSNYMLPSLSTNRDVPATAKKLAQREASLTKFMHYILLLSPKTKHVEDWAEFFVLFSIYLTCLDMEGITKDQLQSVTQTCQKLQGEASKRIKLESKENNSSSDDDNDEKEDDEKEDNSSSDDDNDEKDDYEKESTQDRQARIFCRNVLQEACSGLEYAVEILTFSKEKQM